MVTIVPKLHMAWSYELAEWELFESTTITGEQETVNIIIVGINVFKTPATNQSAFDLVFWNTLKGGCTDDISAVYQRCSR